MKRRDVLASLPAIALALPASSRAQGRTYRVAGLTPIARSAVHWTAFFDELRGDGIVEGQNLQVSGFSVPPERLEAAAQDMARAGVDLVVSGGTGPTRAAQNATTTIPILTALDDFVGQGFARSLTRPGGNITGVSIFGPELDGKRQELLTELVPAARRMTALVDAGAAPAGEAEKLQQAARHRGIDVALAVVRQPAEIAPAIEAARAGGSQAINVLASQFFNVNRQAILEAMALARLPGIYQWPEWCREGGLAAYGPRFTTVYRQLARQAARILRGAPPSSLPIEQPTKFDFAINLGTARAIGLAVPLPLLATVDETVE